jgi:hypothetical protein
VATTEGFARHVRIKIREDELNETLGVMVVRISESLRVLNEQVDYLWKGVTMSKSRQIQQDYFAELHVAGLLANAGWNVYFPHRDKGMDFIISQTGPDGHEIIRPVQVKGKYPTSDKSDKMVYGYVGKLNQIHPEMVLVIPYFAAAEIGPPLFVAYMPFSKIKKHSRGYRCEPAGYKDGKPIPRRDFKMFIDGEGLSLLKKSDWAKR